MTDSWDPTAYDLDVYPSFGKDGDPRAAVDISDEKYDALHAQLVAEYNPRDETFGIDDLQLVEQNVYAVSFTRIQSGATMKAVSWMGIVTWDDGWELRAVEQVERRTFH